MAIFTAIAAALGGGILATAAVNIVGGLVVNALANALFAPDAPDVKAPGIKTKVAQGVVPRSFGVGRFATAGSLVYHNTFGLLNNDPRAHYAVVTALSDLPVGGLVEIWIDDRRCTVDYSNPDSYGRGFPILEYRKDVTKTELSQVGDKLTVQDVTETEFRAWITFYDGTQTTAHQFLIDEVSTAERPWTNSHVGYGVAYAFVVYDFDPDEFSGLPQTVFVLDGYRTYDPSTTEFGTGDDLPAVQIRKLLKAYDYSGEWLYGPQKPGLIASDWNDQITACRAPVPGAASWTSAKKINAFGSTTVPARYRSGMEVDVSRPVSDIISDLATACNGRLSETGGEYRFRVGDPKTADFSITDDDILIDQPQSFSPFFPLAETVNGITAVYPDPDAKWNTQETPPLYRPDYEAEDGNRRLTTSARYDAVPYREQAQRLNKAGLAEARRARRLTVSLPLRYLFVEPLDYLSWSSVRNGFVSKLFRVDGVNIGTTSVTVDLTEVDPSDYDFDADDFIEVVSGTLTDQPTPVYNVPDWSVEGATIRDASGIGRRPALLLKWDGSKRGRGIVYQVRVKATGALVTSGQENEFSAGAVYVSSGILPDTEYEARGRVLRRGKGPAPWSAWLSAITPDIRIKKTDLEQEVQDKLDAAITGALTTADFASSIRPVELLSSLPTTGNSEGRIVFLIPDGKLYRYTSGAWTAAVPAVDVSGQLTNAQIASIAAAKLTGQITETQITDNAISTPKLQAGSISTAKLATDAVTANKIAANAVTAVKIAANTITANEIAANAITASELAADSVTAGKIAAAAITAREIAAGEVKAEQIAVADQTDVVINGRMFYRDGRGWGTSPGLALIPRRTGTTDAEANAPAPAMMRWDPDSTIRNVRVSDDFSVRAGDFIVMAADIATAFSGSDPGNGRLFLQLVYFDVDGVQVGTDTRVYDKTGNAWENYQIRVPVRQEVIDLGAVTAFMKVGRGVNGSDVGSFYVTNIQGIRARGAATLITPGSITSDEIAVGEIKAINMAAGSITADNAAIANLTVDTIQVKDNAITQPVVAFNESPVNIVHGSNNTLVSMVYTKTPGKMVRLRFGLDAFTDNLNSPCHVFFQIMRGGTEIEGTVFQFSNDRLNTVENRFFTGHLSVGTVDQDTSGGTVTYSVRAQIVFIENGSNSTSDFYRTNNKTLEANTFKK